MSNLLHLHEQILKELSNVQIFTNKILPLGHGSSDTTYKIEAHRGSFVLKLFDPSRYTEVHNEIMLLRKLSVYYNSIILPLYEKPIIIANHPGYIYQFFKGELFSEVSIGEKYFTFGKIIGQLDKALQNLPINSITVPNNNLLLLPTQKYLDFSTSRLASKATQIFNEEINHIEFSKINKQYIHKDLHFYNVIYNATEKKYLVIDTSGMSVQFLPREIAVSVGNILVNFFNNFSASNVREIMNGYCTGIKLSRLEKRTIPLFIIQKKLGEIEYLHRQLQLSNQNFHNTRIIKKYMNLSKKNLNYVVEKYENLISFFEKLP